MPDFSRMHTKGKHEAAQDALAYTLGRMIGIIRAGDKLPAADVEEAIQVVRLARNDIAACSSKFSDMIKCIVEDRMPNHSELTIWLTNLSVDLKLKRLDLIDVARLEEGHRLVNDLDDCRESLVMR